TGIRVIADPHPKTGCAPVVSVIIATCGRQEFLLDCIGSILRNDFQDFEIIIVDQDRERTLQAAIHQRFGDDGRLCYVILDEPNLSRARNTGVERARGDILIFSDDDVEVDPSWLRAYVDAFDTYGVAVIGGRLDAMWLNPRPGWLPARKEYM